MNPQIEIKPEFRDLIPPLSAEEYAQLEKNIIQDGCRDPLVLWGNILVDGHNRYKICQAYDIAFKTVLKEFKDEYSIKEWIIRTQFGRRNLSLYDRGLLAIELEQILKPVFQEKAKENQVVRKGNQRGTTPQNSAKLSPVETRKEISKVSQVSHDTISKIKTIKAKATQKQKEKLRLGDESVNKIYTEIKKAERKETQLQKEKDAPIVENIDSIIDYKDTYPECDAIITDPPYAILDEKWDKVEIQMFTKEWLKKANATNANFILSFFSQEFLFLGKEWFDSMLTNYSFQQLLVWHYPNNKKPQSQMGFKQTWEPVFFYRHKDCKKKISIGSGEWGENLNDFDCHVSATPQTNFKDVNTKQHPAQKPLSVMLWIVNATTDIGEKVFDPFTGSGTTGIACKQLKRNFIGYEKEKDFRELAKRRIATYGQ